MTMTLLTLVIFPFLSLPLIHLLFVHLRLCLLQFFLGILSTLNTSCHISISLWRRNLGNYLIAGICSLLALDFICSFSFFSLLVFLISSLYVTNL
uniref:Putative ovule protein n=1 Tax=Solanum chacoense TaxID=4108 RepID=A0A0V0HM97_SOLCH